MPTTKIFVGKLSDSVTADDLRKAFEKYGSVAECDVLKNYGFVHMNNSEDASKSIDALNNSQFMGSTITVEASRSTVRQKPGMGGRGTCFRCGRIGHWSKECPKATPSPSSSYGRDIGRNGYSPLGPGFGGYADRDRFAMYGYPPVSPWDAVSLRSLYERDRPLSSSLGPYGDPYLDRERMRDRLAAESAYASLDYPRSRSPLDYRERDALAYRSASDYRSRPYPDPYDRSYSPGRRELSLSGLGGSSSSSMYDRRPPADYPGYSRRSPTSNGAGPR